MQAALLVFFILGGPMLFAFMIAFPDEFYAILTMLYNPYSRIGAISTVLLFTFLYVQRKKRSRHTYDYFDDLQIMEARVDGLTYHYKVQKHREENRYDYVKSVLLYVDGEHGYDFSLKFESQLEKFLKSWRLIHECQSGDKRFDETIFIVSDEDDVCSSLKENTPLREALFKLFWEEKERGYCIKELRYFDGRIVLTCNVEIETTNTKEFLDSSALKLSQILHYFPEKPSESALRYREKTAFILQALYLLFGALIFNGGLKLYIDSMHVFYLPRVVERYDLIYPAIFSTLILFGLFILFALLIFRKSTRLARALTLGVTMGVLGFFLSSLTLLKEINIYLDDSQPQLKPSTVVSKYVHRGKHTVYFMSFGGYGEMQVPREVYNRFDMNTAVRVKEKQGYLGIRWIVEIKKFDAQALIIYRDKYLQTSFSPSICASSSAILASVL